MEAVSKVIPIAMLVFVVSSMLAVGLSLTVKQILAPLRDRRLVTLALVANFILMPISAFAISSTTPESRSTGSMQGGNRRRSPRRTNLDLPETYRHAEAGASPQQPRVT